ncbi:selenocysteine-specific translation elongation factor [Spongiactinospora sp. TRM90649]|uniref:selenocysteine-specific translation elongation factor n=1 Tax=Spongiactinospora sp. TRM90649 TaxID=3031114 RepID=UPI0023F79D0B|nr:selenocysteine-specific translation elongation factor [Spongiactinospora sp. TRM90649]MDF5759180.1 selenocysteine-specific translation elongation factor [Spongiactinospora sp. TRM90649]
MHVIATAGHVDHGKSTLVRALTGIEPDRWDEERRRGMTIDLGFAWTTLDGGGQVAFVDVPGHARFVTNMLAGLGPVPAVLFVVAADQGWQAQSQEHWEAVRALGVEHGLLAVTRCDLMDPGPALEEAGERVGWPAVTVSGATGDGLGELRRALLRLTAGLPTPDPRAPVRLWIDRAFTVKGAGTVVTGTLTAGTLRVGDPLLLAGERVRVKALQALGEPVGEVTATARVAVNLRGVERARTTRGMTLLTPDSWLETEVADVRLDARSDVGDRPPRESVLHIGSASVPARVRPLGPGTARLTLGRPLPLRVGDRALLRTSGRPIAGVRVLDVRPPALRRAGAAGARAAQLAPFTAGTGDRVPEAETVLRWRGVVRRAELAAMGCDPDAAEASGAGEWLVDPARWAELSERLGELVAGQPGIPVDAARTALGLPSRELVEALVAARPPLSVADGRVDAGTGLPDSVLAAVERLRPELAAAPYQAPGAARLAELGLTTRAVALAARAGLLVRLADGVVLLAGADTAAARLLAALGRPFTAADARTALDTTRRVVIPLLEHLDRLGLTRRLDDRLRVADPPP